MFKEVAETLAHTATQKEVLDRSHVGKEEATTQIQVIHRALISDKTAHHTEKDALLAGKLIMKTQRPAQGKAGFVDVRPSIGGMAGPWGATP